MIERLIAAWEEWDQRPGSENAALHRVDMERLVANELQLDYLTFVENIAANRRAGMTVANAIKSATGKETNEMV